VTWALVASKPTSGPKSTSSFHAAPDWLAPTVGATVIAKATGYLPGAVKPGGTYYVYATVTDDGSPPSGVAAENADVHLITPGGSAVPLAAGSYSVAGVSYTYRSDALTAGAVLPGPRAYSITSTDVAGNTRTQTGYSVSVDETAPTGIDIQTADRGGVHGQAETGDIVSFHYSEQIDPESILAGWTGSSTTVVVRLVDGGCEVVGFSTLCEPDRLAVYDPTNTTQLPIGSVNLGNGKYHGTAPGTAPPLTFGAGGTPSTMVQSAGVISVTLGTASGLAETAPATGEMVWDPSLGAYDAAGNPAASTPVTEPGLADREF
jgi:hypothetical protein